MNLPHPVVFVPGITASELRDEYPVDFDRLWTVLSKDYSRVALHPDDPRYEAHQPSRVVGDRVFQLIYSEFIEELRHNLAQRPDQPVPVFAFGYDWRQPLELTAAHPTSAPPPGNRPSRASAPKPADRFRPASLRRVCRPRHAIPVVEHDVPDMLDAIGTQKVVVRRRASVDAIAVDENFDRIAFPD